MTPVASASSAGVSCDAASSVTRTPCSRCLVPWHGDGSKRLSATAAAGVVGRKARSNPCKLWSAMCWTVCCSSASDAGRGGMGPGPLGRVLLSSDCSQGRSERWGVGRSGRSWCLKTALDWQLCSYNNITTNKCKCNAKASRPYQPLIYQRNE